MKLVVICIVNSLKMFVDHSIAVMVGPYLSHLCLGGNIYRSVSKSPCLAILNSLPPFKVG